MAEEFDESEVVFSNGFSSVPQRGDEENKNLLLGSFGERNMTRRIKIKKSATDDKAALSSSVPVNIPENMFLSYVNGKEEEEEEHSDGGGEMVPPHIMVGRSYQGGQMAFSVCSGSGRTLKGRDLSRVRNSVLRLTGFLEA
ncbi:hypothetical protein CARUB_v10024774mg [Capsella rubella]|uniref:Senescence regulator n=1 Tax=Capsella rubella TaxID=81985 RepID=R0FZL9_9BRAS|nr:uncharacterized protein LOC17889360 [Capsella rubella]EOA28557.1 hypothetical protein CARUB_v10024774mg [Capsella rubella]